MKKENSQEESRIIILIKWYQDLAAVVLMCGSVVLFVGWGVYKFIRAFILEPFAVLMVVAVILLICFISAVFDCKLYPEG